MSAAGRQHFYTIKNRNQGFNVIKNIKAKYNNILILPNKLLFPQTI